MTTTISPEASVGSKPIQLPLPGSSSSSHSRVDTHFTDAAGPIFSSAIALPETKQDALAGHPSHSTTAAATPIPVASSESSSPAAIHASHLNDPAPQGMLLFNPYLCLLSDSLDDLEVLRIATDNRVRSLTRDEADSDGVMRGLGLDARSPEVARSMALAERIGHLEHQSVLDLKRELRRSPFFPWVQRSKGIGEKQAARLLAVIGDPYWNDLYDRPRTVSELWAYCGYAVHNGRADRRQKGVLSNWNDKAKMRAYLMAESCVKTTGDYRKVYDDARQRYADASHPHDCVRCGPKGKPALAGTPLAAGHQHARALRLVAKEILKDLWLEARDYHESEAA